MKQKICVVLVMVFFCSSCGLVKPEQPPEVNFSFCAPVTLQDETVFLQGVWDSTHAEQATLTLCAPETVEGITLTQIADRLTVSFRELSYPFPIESFPKDQMIRCLFEIFRNWRNRPFSNKPTKEEDRWIFSENCAGTDFCLYTDLNGQIQLLTVGLQIKVVFETQKA